MKTFCLIQIMDLQFQVGHISPKKIRLFEEYDESPVDTNLYINLSIHREMKMISDGTKVIRVEVV